MRISHFKKEIDLVPCLGVWTHGTYKVIEDKDILPWTPLSMVWLSMTSMELGLSNEDLCSLLIQLAQVYVHWSMSVYFFLSIVEIFLCVAFQDDLLMNWGVMTMLWLGEGCSSYEHVKSLSIWYSQELVNNGFSFLCALSAKITWWCYKFYELLYHALKSVLWQTSPKCHLRTNVPKCGIL